MNFYIDIILKLDDEIKENRLLNLVYTNLHKRLYEIKSTYIGVSFPNAELKLGNVIRLHGSENNLNTLMSADWIGGLNNYCLISEAQRIPGNVMHRTISRTQPSKTFAKLRRLQKRGKLTSDVDLKAYKAAMFAEILVNPYLELISASTSEKYRRFIEFGKLTEQPTSGIFDHFGLSKLATIPWF